ncbi:OmpP1/FadL family transporter [Burkholderia sp. BCC0322]|uniref:OmpP1/FadL family transporter n=1 Tax=unclassified Burkholderia TaxID=2613784 RepID=UPI001588F72D|nr:outer membrane protein transport protein [Burkholderia sp. BCC0322]
MERRKVISLVLALSVGVVNVCVASTGIYTTGYGTREQGMGGVGVAAGESALAPAGNPAGIAFSGDRLEIGGGLFVIHGGAQENGTTYSAQTGITPMPEFGYVKSLSQSLVFGVASWAAGAAMSYRTPYGPFPQNSNTSSEAILMHVAPTVAYRFGAEMNHALALSLVGALSTVNVKGVETQTGLPNQGRNWTPGYGFKIGWMSQITSQISMGAFYASKIRYTPWYKYDHILADGGRFEEPVQYGVGIAFRPTPKWLIGFDWIRFNYGGTHMLGNPIDFSEPLGAVNGSGFGLTNVNAYRVGVQYDVTDKLTLRGGFEITNQPVTPANTAFTFLAPVTPNRTYTVGATYCVSKQSELSFAYSVSPRVQINGTGLSAGTNSFGQNNSVAFAYTKKF